MKIIVLEQVTLDHILLNCCLQSHDVIYLIRTERLNTISSQIDVFTIAGDAKSVEIMEQKLISSCDLLIAVTSSEEAIC